MARLMFGGKLLNRSAKRHRWLQRLLWWLEGSLLIGLWWLWAWIPVRWASRIGRWGGRLLGPHLDRSRHIRGNLEVSFPALDPAQRRSLMREIWGGVGALIAEYPHLASIVRGTAGAGLEWVVSPRVAAFHRPARPVIFVCAHLSNWELGPAAGAYHGARLAVFYTPLRNPVLDRLLARSRGVLGYAMLPRDAGMRQMMRELRQGTSIGFVMDQRVDSGEAIPFFGRPKATTLIPARLALRYGCQLVPVRVQRLSGVHFRVSVHDPIEPEEAMAGEHAQAIEMTCRINRLFESWIRERPQEWFCANRRWSKSLQGAATRA